MKFYPFRSIGKKVFILILNCLMYSAAFAQTEEIGYRNNWSLGVKFSNPSGLSLKKYFNNKALELNVGRLNSWKQFNYYKWEYNHHYKGSRYTFEGYDHVYQPIAIQLHYLVHKDIDLFRGLTWYYGLGAQFRSAEYYYLYTYEDGSLKYSAKEKVRYFGVGADAIAGLEYTFSNFPVSVFYDANIYMEAFEHPLYLKLQSGLGLRYNF